MTPFQNPDCYARALGGCSKETSGEHYVSKSVLELIEHQDGQVSRTVRVTGLSFQRAGELKPIGVGRLTAEILCQIHNSLLSPYDSAGKEMFLAMHMLDEAARNPLPTRQTISVDGDRLERWILKTYIGGLFSGAFRMPPVGTGTMKGEIPHVELLEILFAGKSFPKGQGLYWMPPKPGEVITTRPEILQLAPLVSDDGYDVGGCRFWFFGFEFCLLAAVVAAGTFFDTAVYRPAGLVGGNVAVAFAWQNGAQSPEIQLQVVKPGKTSDS